MRCEDVQEILDRCDLGDDRGTSPEVQAHVQSCSECREFASDLALVANALVQIPMERFSEAKSRELKARITALEQQALAEREAAEARPSLLDRLAYLVAGPRLAWGVAALGVLFVAVIGLHYSVTPEAERVAMAPEEASSPVAVVPLKTQAVELVEGDLLVSGLLLNISRIGKHQPQIHVPQGKSLTTLPNRKATIQLSDGTRVALAGSTQLKLGDRQLMLASGSVAVHVKKTGRGFTTRTPSSTTLVMGTRFTADVARVELVEGSVEIRGTSGQATTLKPGQAASTTQPGVTVSTIDPTRMTELYQTFAKLDSKESLAADLGMTVAQLDSAINPPPVALPALPQPEAPQQPAPVVKPARPTGPRLPMPGEMTVPEYQEGSK